MDLYIARQPVFDKHLNVFGYELLYRKNQENRFLETDADEASSNVIINAFNILGIDKLTGGNRAFVNFTGNLLKQRVATLFPKDELVVEILETVQPTEETIRACLELKQQGYLLALDDFVNAPIFKPFVDLADIIKVDFTLSPEWERKSIVRQLGNGRIRFLAEKIETQEEFEKAKAWGYSFFQGFFFSRPVIQPMAEIPPMKVNQLRLLELMNKKDIEFAELSNIVTQDVSLSYKLLKLVNSSAFGLRAKIDSVRHALVMLGMAELRKWLSLIVMRGLAESKPAELVRISLIRARMLERLGLVLKMQGKTDDLFILGLFSCLDVLMDRPMAELLQGVSVSTEVKLALLQQEGVFGFLISLVRYYEKGTWDEVTRYSDMLGIEHAEVCPTYLQAVEWCTGVLES